MVYADYSFVLSDITLPHWIRDALYSEIKDFVQEEFALNIQILHEKDAIP